jgi:hypothetical protein
MAHEQAYNDTPLPKSLLFGLNRQPASSFWVSLTPAKMCQRILKRLFRSGLRGCQSCEARLRGVSCAWVRQVRELFGR